MIQIAKVLRQKTSVRKTSLSKKHVRLFLSMASLLRSDKDSNLSRQKASHATRLAVLGSSDQTLLETKTISDRKPMALRQPHQVSSTHPLLRTTSSMKTQIRTAWKTSEGREELTFQPSRGHSNSLHNSSLKTASRKSRLPSNEAQISFASRSSASKWRNSKAISPAGPNQRSRSSSFRGKRIRLLTSNSRTEGPL